MNRKSALQAKLRPLLSQWDCEEVYQTCALQLHTTGALYRDERFKLKLSDWIACFRACRAVLRIDRKAREDSTDTAKLHDVAQTVTETERFTARRTAIARRVRYMRACITEAHNCDKSRKRAFNRKRALRFLRLVTSQATACGLGSATVTLGNDTSALRHASLDFKRYCDTGEKLLEKRAQLDVAQREAHLATTAQGEAKTFRALTFRAKRAQIAA